MSGVEWGVLAAINVIPLSLLVYLQRRDDWIGEAWRFYRQMIGSAFRQFVSGKR